MEWRALKWVGSGGWGGEGVEWGRMGSWMENGIVRRWGEGGGKQVMRGLGREKGWIEKMEVEEVC